MISLVEVRVFVVLFLILPFVLMGQTGPAGVGNSSSNGLWLRAGDIDQANNTEVDLWPDTSGNQNHAVQNTTGRKPVFYTVSSINSQPVVRLDGVNDQMVVADHPLLDGTTGITYFAVIRPYNINGSARGILGKRITFTVEQQYAYTWFFYTGNRLFLDVHTNNNRFNTTATFSNSTNYLLNWRFDGSKAASQRSRIRSGNSILTTAFEASSSLPNSNQDLAIGALNVDYGTYFNADYAEIIHFNFALDTLQSLLVHNYLSAKYDIGLSNNDLFDEDNALNGNYDFEVAGIGRISASAIQNDAKGSGMLRILNPTHLNNNEFLIWGHNNDTAQARDSLDVPPSVDARFRRVWRFSEVNGSQTPIDVGAVDVRWYLSGLGPVDATDLRLLIDSNNDGLFIDETPISGATHLGADVYEFSGVTGIADGLRMTLATADIGSTPLPVSLLYFKLGENSYRNVLIEWQTATEINNHYFTVEKSADGRNWESLRTVEGAGTSMEAEIYRLYDPEPFSGVTYYRLSQTDFDGSTTYFDPQAIQFKPEESNTFLLHPNPARDRLFIQCACGSTDLLLYQSSGRKLDLRLLSGMENELILDVSHLSPGTYYLRMEEKVYKFLKF
jgi:hypothetical protein